MKKIDISNFKKLLEGATTILILQPEKPDTDSLTSSLALEQILGDLGKQVILYCQDPIPKYIAYFEGADRVVNDFPSKFDLTVLVDTGTPQQLSRTLKKHQGALVKRPFVVIDHHAHRESMPFDSLELVESALTSTCEVVIEICRQLNWAINSDAANLLVPGILADTRNLSIQTVTPGTFRTIADLIEQGADIHQIHQAYRLSDALSPELLKFKGQLLGRMELYCDGKIGLIAVTPAELKQWAEVHDPSDLVIYDMLWSLGVQVAGVIRSYGGESGKIKISTRAHLPVAAKTCEHFGGGGHDRAAGCQINNTPVDEVKDQFVKVLCDNIKQYEANQHAHPNQAAV